MGKAEFLARQSQRIVSKDIHEAREDRRKGYGRLIAKHLLAQKPPTLLLDMDGVVFKGDGLDHPTVAALGIIPVLHDLEKIGVNIGIATGRGDTVIDFLQGHELKIEGPKILEGGQVISSPEGTTYLTDPKHQDFIARVDAEVVSLPGFVEDWAEVKKRAANGEFAFCLGNFQWRGDCTTFLWFDGNQVRDVSRIANIFQTITGLATEHGLDFNTDVATTFFHMVPDEKRGAIAMLKLAGKKEGKSINKATAAEQIAGTWVFAADGSADKLLANLTKTREDGFVIGIKGSVDAVAEVNEFLDGADILLDGPHEFARVLRYAADILLEEKNYE